VLAPGAAAVPGFELMRDGDAVGAVEFGVASPVDPGAHTISARATGREPWSTTIELPAQATTVSVTVPVLSAQPAPPSARAAASAVAPSTAVTEVARPRVDTAPAHPGLAPPQVLGLSLAAAGVLSLGAGAVLGLTAKSTYDSSNREGHCSATNECDEFGKGRRSAASGLATGSTIAISAGGAALAGGALLYLFTARRETKSTVSLVPVLGVRDAGLSLRRVW
jgi:hypothetical protein